MEKVTLKSVKDCDAIFTNGQDVLVCGKTLWLFRGDGSFVAKFKAIRNPHKAVFLPGNTVLVDGLGDGFYHLISLDQGKLLWSSLKKGRRNSMTAQRFAISSDGMIVYDVCHCVSGGLYIDRIIPHKQIHDRLFFNDGLRVTRDIFCMENGSLYILQSHILYDSTDPYSQNAPPVKQHGILEISVNQGVLNHRWIRRWESRPNAVTTEVGCDGNRILREDFSVLDLNSMDTYSILNDTDLQMLPHDGFGWFYEAERQLLTVYYVAEKLNIIIDCKQRKVVARYVRDDLSVGYQGCLIGNTFWTGTTQGIVKRPFPNMDDVI